MNERELRDGLLAELQAILPADGHVTAKPVDVVKINDEELFGITIRSDSSLTAPTYYSADLMPLFYCGETLSSIAEKLYDRYLEGPSVLPVKIDARLPYGKVRNKLSLRVVDMDRNVKYLSTVPYLTVGNGLALVCDVTFFSKRSGVYKAPITNSIAEEGKYDVNKLFRDALANARTTEPPIILNEEPELGCFAITNKSGNYGASVLFYPGFMDTLTYRTGGDYYVLPVSLHELMIVPARSVERASFLLDIVARQNSRMPLHNVFTDKVFYYNCEDEELVTVDRAFAEQIDESWENVCSLVC